MAELHDILLEGKHHMQVHFASPCPCTITCMFLAGMFDLTKHDCLQPFQAAHDLLGSMCLVA